MHIPIYLDRESISNWLGFVTLEDGVLAVVAYLEIHYVLTFFLGALGSWIIWSSIIL